MGERRYSPLLELTKARLREFLREPGMVFWVFGFPVLMVVALGLAFRNSPAAPPRVVVTDAVEPWIVQALNQAEHEVVVLPQAQAEQQLRTGKRDLMVLEQGGKLSYRLDKTRPEGRLARLMVDDALQRARGRQDVLSATEQELVEPGARYVDFLLPGVIGLNLMGSSIWGIGYNVVVARKRKLLKRFAASPMRHSHFLLAYALSRLVFLGFELVALVVLGSLAFGVQIHGSYLAFGIVSMVGAAAFAGLSLTVGARAQSIETANGWLNFIMLPMWLLSGSFFSYERFPEVMHPFIQLLPLTALNDALRAISSEGAALGSTWPQLLVLAVWGAVSFVVALRTFRWQ